MIKVTILNKSKPKTLLLIHGLFSSSGYWLPYLQTLKYFRLIVLDIDYRVSSDVDLFVSEVNYIIDTIAGGFVYAVISHSLGTLVANRLHESTRHFSFEICPVYYATRIKRDDFVGEIERRIKFSMTKIEILDLLTKVDYLIVKSGVPMETTINPITYIPDEDHYFSYNVDTEFIEFRGDHFNIAEAIADIGTVLA